MPFLQDKKLEKELEMHRQMPTDKGTERSEQYIEDCLKTLSMDISAIKSRLEDDSTIHLLHAVIGMATEAGELLDMMKKHIFYGKGLDLVNLEEELGDSDWYQSIAIHSARLKGHHTAWEIIWSKNIAKLKARYGDKFSETKAENRDLEKERSILEDVEVKSVSLVEKPMKGKEIVSSYDVVDVNGFDYLVDIDDGVFSIRRKSKVVGTGFVNKNEGVRWLTNEIPEEHFEELDTYLVETIG